MATQRLRVGDDFDRRVQHAKPRRRGGVLRWIAGVLAAVALLPALMLGVYRVVDPPLTPLMLLRGADGAPQRREWVPLERIAPAVQRAVLAAEDARFCTHRGFDWQEMSYVWQRYREGGNPRGASTISMQVAKNLFLWPQRSVVRKGLEAYITLWVEAILPKARILEIYLNFAEWGDGIYGIETAARSYYGKAAAAIAPSEAALLAAVLPNPRRYSVLRPSLAISERAAIIRLRAPIVAIPGSRGCV
jgi:monofunctional glycosyltransferase